MQNPPETPTTLPVESDPQFPIPSRSSSNTPSAVSRDHAVLENRRRVAEDEIDGSGDVTAAVELSVCLCVQSVFVSLHSAVDEGGSVGLYSESDGLVFFRSGGVAESDGLGHESFSESNWIRIALR